MLTHAANAKRAKCPKCVATIELPTDAFAAKLVCPQCGARLGVGMTSHTSAKPDSRASEEYELEPPIERTHAPVELNPPPREIRADPLPPPPQYPFFSGVFSFPWTGGALIAWLIMSVGLGLVSLFAGLIVTGITGGAGSGGAVMAGFLILSGVWIFFLTLSYTAACFVGVVEDTADGFDRITDWPDINWREWFWALWGPVYMLVLAGFPGCLLGALLPGYRILATLATAFVLFPILQLSAMEAGTPFVPYSPPVVHTLRSHWGAWLGFYAIALSTCTVAAIACSGVYIVARVLEPFAEGPLLAATILIYARLLGRLAWIVQVEAPDQNRSKRQRARRDKTVRVEDLL